jgi:hypothetical protein
LEIPKNGKGITININIIDGVQIANATSGYNNQATTGNKDGKLICGHVDHMSRYKDRLFLEES